MTNYCGFILIIVCLCNSLTDAKNISSMIWKKKSDHHGIYYLVKNFLDTCGFGTKKVMIYDDFYNLETFAAIAEIQPQISVSLFSDIASWRRMHRPHFDDLEIDAIIIIIRPEIVGDIFVNLFMKWHYNRDCIVYIFPTPFHECTNYRAILELIMRFYFIKAYFICLMNERFVHVYTHDPYGDTKPQYWDKIQQFLLWGKNWTIYERSYDKDMIQLCPGFNFERTDLSNQEFVVFGLKRNHIELPHLKNEDALYNDEVEDYLIQPYQEKLPLIRKYLKLKFLYFTVQVTEKPGELMQRAYSASGVDVLLKNMIMSLQLNWDYVYPISYENIAILSHHRGFLTPLEKIAKFYGIWVLLSLIIILLIAFTVMLFSTRNLNLAILNILRLLVNVEIQVLINRGSLKLFFMMIFLYFLIIHATFSGHLAEFLTKVEHRRNIDTIEELEDSQVKKIYNFGYRFTEEFQTLRGKLKHIYHASECNEIVFYPNHVCVGPKVILEMTRMNMETQDNPFYMSKNTFGLSLISLPHRPGFPLVEKFNQALTFLFDTDLIAHLKLQNRRILSRSIEKQLALKEVSYRAIIVKDLRFAFTLLIIGYCISFISFVFEIMWKHLYNICKADVKKTNVVSIEVQPYN